MKLQELNEGMDCMIWLEIWANGSEGSCEKCKGILNSMKCGEFD
jgi:hypothetical protein